MYGTIPISVDNRSCREIASIKTLVMLKPATQCFGAGSSVNDTGAEAEPTAPSCNRQPPPNTRSHSVELRKFLSYSLSLGLSTPSSANI